MMREAERGDVSDKMLDGKNFSRLCCECQAGGWRREGSSITTNISDPKARKSIERFFIYIYIYISIYIYVYIIIPSSLSLSFFFLKNQIIQIPQQKKQSNLRALFKLHMTLKEERPFFYDGGSVVSRGLPGTSFHIFVILLKSRNNE